MNAATHLRAGRLIRAMRVAGRELLHSELLGRLDYYRFPKLKAGFGGPFNGQQGRQDIFNEIAKECAIDCVIETGTYRGTTTEYMATTTGLPTYTIELDPRFAGYAKMRLHRFPKVQVLKMDSRTAIRNLPVQTGTPFCYLDAHWNDDLPLDEEVELIFRRWPNAVILIDDFEVKGDAGYSFDNYGPGKKLCLEYLQTSARNEYSFFFPAMHSSQETGLRRGSVVVVVAGSQNAGRIDSIAQLRRWTTQVTTTQVDRSAL